MLNTRKGKTALKNVGLLLEEVFKANHDNTDLKLSELNISEEDFSKAIDIMAKNGRNKSIRLTEEQIDKIVGEEVPVNPTKNTSGYGNAIFDGDLLESLNEDEIGIIISPPSKLNNEELVKLTAILVKLPLLDTPLIAKGIELGLEGIKVLGVVATASENAIINEVVNSTKFGLASGSPRTELVSALKYQAEDLALKDSKGLLEEWKHEGKNLDPKIKEMLALAAGDVNKEHKLAEKYMNLWIDQKVEDLMPTHADVMIEDEDGFKEAKLATVYEPKVSHRAFRNYVEKTAYPLGSHLPPCDTDTVFATLQAVDDLRNNFLADATIMLAKNVGDDLGYGGEDHHTNIAAKRINLGGTTTADINVYNFCDNEKDPIVSIDINTFTPFSMLKEINDALKAYETIIEQ